MGIFGKNTKDKRLAARNSSHGAAAASQQQQVRRKPTHPPMSASLASQPSLSPNNLPPGALPINFSPGAHSIARSDTPQSPVPPPSEPIASEPKETPEQAVWRDWSGRGQHVEFKEGEKVPLEPGEILGHGSNGLVVKTTCKGVVLAWKSMVYAPRAEPTMLQEKDILMRLDHIHMVKMVGTYKHQQSLGRVEVGLLTWPVAVCDLAAFLKDTDHVTGLNENAAGQLPLEDQQKQKQRLQALGIDPSKPEGVMNAMTTRMCQSFGCLASAVAYLHSREVKHKDIKPANILIYRDTIRLTDFGTSRDFSEQGMSATDNGGARGTAKYFSPETATWSSPGRPADIFSLGCVFLEMLYSVLPTVSLSKLDELRPEADSSGRSYQANLAHINKWSDTGSPSRFALHLIIEIQSMLQREPSSRPKADDLNARLNVIGQLGETLHGPCCSQTLKHKKESEGELKRSQEESTALARHNRELEERFKSLMEKNRKLEDKLKRRTEECMYWEGKEGGNAIRIHELELKLEAKEKEVAPLTQALGNKSKELEESQSHVETLEGTLTAYMKTSSENTRLKKEMLQKEKEVAITHSQVKALQNNKTLLEAKIHEVAKDLQMEKNAGVERLKVQNDNFMNEIDRILDKSKKERQAYKEMENAFEEQLTNAQELELHTRKLEEQRDQAIEQRAAVYATFSSFGATFKRFEDEMAKHHQTNPPQRLPTNSRSDSGYETRDSNASSLSSIIGKLGKT